MRSFMQSGVHRRVMARLPEWCNEAALSIGFKMTRNRLPGRRRIGAWNWRVGVRGSIIRREAQRRFEIHEPRTSATS